ncbi:MAG: hypothetical protein IPN76_05235 [Saprospiraceae bacterium]|nr:hypothetical protein [Saprospiraceae bacterium]
MPIPDFQSIMLPLLQSCADGQEHGLRETIETLATVGASIPLLFQMVALPLPLANDSHWQVLRKGL